MAIPSIPFKENILNINLKKKVYVSELWPKKEET